MDKNYDFYLCPTCFEACKTPKEGHNHAMLSCYAGKPGDERRKPMTDIYGNYVSRAPRWFLEATGQIPAWTPIHWNDSKMIQ
jgi:hypothetical protein